MTDTWGKYNPLLRVNSHLRELVPAAVVHLITDLNEYGREIQQKTFVAPESSRHKGRPWHLLFFLTNFVTDYYSMSRRNKPSSNKAKNRADKQTPNISENNGQGGTKESRKATKEGGNKETRKEAIEQAKATKLG